MPQNTPTIAPDLADALKDMIPAVEPQTLLATVTDAAQLLLGRDTPPSAGALADAVLRRTAFTVKDRWRDGGQDGNAYRVERTGQGIVVAGCHNRDDAEGSAVDLLAHLMHWCDAHDVDFEHAVQLAYVHHAVEVDEERPAVTGEGKCDECGALVDPDPPYDPETHEQHCSAHNIDEHPAPAGQPADERCACGNALDDGEGWDGRCGSCADRAENGGQQ